jgi:hypothetical protein
MGQSPNRFGFKLVESVFSVEVAERICGLAICPRLQQDQIIWAGTKNGVFSMRSAYLLELERKNRFQSSSSISPDNSLIWDTIWSMKIPRVIQMFIWRACSEILPTLEKLYFRKVVNDPLCPIFRLEVESSAHVIWRCSASIAVWSECNRSIQKCVVADGEILSIFEHLNLRLSVEDLGLVFVIAQKVWLRRNKMIFGGPVMPPTCLIKCAEDVLKNFNLAKDTGRDILQVSCPKQSKWQKPPQGMLKINWDVAVDKGSKIMGEGIIIRDHSGEVCASSCSTRPHVVDPFVAEALRARHGVELCIELGLQSVLLEGDAKEIVNAIAKGGVSSGSCGSIIDHTRSLLSQVHTWAIQHVPREFNAAAHKLARFAIDQRQHRVWMDSFPLFLESNVPADKLDVLS